MDKEHLEAFQTERFFKFQELSDLAQIYSNFPCFPCIIVQPLEKKHLLYGILCKHGVSGVYDVLLYRESELEGYSGCLQVQVKGWERVPKISIREVAKKSNEDNDFYGTHCACTNCPALVLC